MSQRQQRAALHVTNAPEDVDRMVGVASRLQQRIPGLLIQIVVSGDAVHGTIGTTPLEAPEGVTVDACQHALTEHGYEATEVQPGIGTVPTAISALISAQLDGAAYMRI